jgi:hypothetical protein
MSVSGVPVQPVDVPIKCPQHADVRVHHEIAAFGSADQARNRGLPFFEALLTLRQLHYVVGGILERDEPAAAWQPDRVVELPLPALGRHQD